MNIRLRNIEAQDLPTLFRHQSDPDSVRMAVVYPRGLAEFDEHWARILADPSVIARGIIVDDVLVGHISCFRMDSKDSVGYWIGREYWGRGIATRALALLLNEVSIRPLHARAARENIGSVRVLEKCGFRVIAHEMSPDDGRFPVCEEAILQLDGDGSRA